MEKTINIKVSNLTDMHTVRLADGSFQKIISIGNGMKIGCKLIHYTNGEWSDVPNKDVVEARLMKCGIDIGTTEWIVGPATKFGTIDVKTKVAAFDTMEEVEELCKKLNGEN
jgi:hypothetical protein